MGSPRTRAWTDRFLLFDAGRNPGAGAGFNDRLGSSPRQRAGSGRCPLRSNWIRHHRITIFRRTVGVSLERRDASISVRMDDGAMRQEAHTLACHLGEVIYRTPSHVFVVKSTRLDALRYFEGSTDEQGSESCRVAGSPAPEPRADLELHLADAEGNILYQWNARLPVRRAGTDYRLDVGASSSRDIWSRLHP